MLALVMSQVVRVPVGTCLLLARAPAAGTGNFNLCLTVVWPGPGDSEAEAANLLVRPRAQKVAAMQREGIVIYPARAPRRLRLRWRRWLGVAGVTT